MAETAGIQFVDQFMCIQTKENEAKYIFKIDSETDSSSDGNYVFANEMPFL